MDKLKIVNVVGARPNFMKIAPIIDVMKTYPAILSFLVHTGQHYDRTMSELFFDNLGLPKPDIYLGIGSGGHGEQTGRIMIAFERVLKDLRPDLVLVVGDVNSTIACGLVSVKMHIRLVHVEAGLRSYDRTMPEEINRVLTDQISDYLFTTEAAARENLVREGVDPAKVHFVGNVMIDSLRKHQDLAAKGGILKLLNLEERGYVLTTLHRPSNVDDPEVLEKLVEVLCRVSERLPVVFPIHPRTRKRLGEFALETRMQRYEDLRILDPLGYLDFLHLMSKSSLVLTDSGGIQEETTVLGVPCITLRESTERPVTVTQGTNIVVGRDTERILSEAMKATDGNGKKGDLPALWDGKAAERIVKTLWEREGW